MEIWKQSFNIRGATTSGKRHTILPRFVKQYPGAKLFHPDLLSSFHWRKKGNIAQVGVICVWDRIEIMWLCVYISKNTY